MNARMIALTGVTLLLVCAMQTSTVHAQLLARWPDLNMTYRIDVSCSTTENHANEFFMQPLNQALNQWSQWLAGYVNFTEIQSGERVTFMCSAKYPLPSGKGGEMRINFNPSSGYFYAPVQIWVTVPSSPSLGVFIFEHEIGHALGLVDESGGIMSKQPDWISLANAAPTSDQLNEIRDTYPPLSAPKLNWDVESFSVEINNNSEWIINGSYYSNPASSQLVLVIGGGALFPSGYAYIGWNGLGTGIPDSVLMHIRDSGFNVAVIQTGTFIISSTLAINGVLKYLATKYGTPSSVSLIGFSAGGTVTAAYLLSEGRCNITRAVILDAQLAPFSFNTSTLTVPTLLIYGENDTVTPSHANGGAWLTNAPANMTAVELYSYEHNPWGNESSFETRVEVEQRIIQYLLGPVPVPEMPTPIIALLIAFGAVLLIQRSHKHKSSP